MSDSEARDYIGVNLKSYNSQLNYPKFILDKSKIERKSDSKFLIDVYQYAERPASPVDITYLKNVNPTVISCKMRSAEDVARYTGREFEEKSCAEMNLDILKEVAQLLNQTDKDVLSAKLDIISVE